MTARLRFGGLAIVASPALPVLPSPGEDARRIVRHGLAHVLAWLGEDVGPEPGDPTHAFRAGNTLVVSQAFLERMVVPEVARIAARHVSGGIA